MRVRRLKVWSWSDYRYPMWFFGGLSVFCVLALALIGAIGLFATAHNQDKVIASFSADATCRSGINTSTNVVTLDVLDYVLGDQATPQQRQAVRDSLRVEVRDARRVQVAAPVACNTSGTSVPLPPIPPPPAPPSTTTSAPGGTP
jgi:hypothetical protein